MRSILTLFIVSFLISGCATTKVDQEKELITIYVQGAVLRTGKYEVEKGSYSVNALVLAGGFADSARPFYWVVYEKDPTKRHKLDIHRILKGEQDDLILEDNCVIKVLTESWGGRIVYKPDEVLVQMKEHLKKESNQEVEPTSTTFD